MVTSAATATLPGFAPPPPPATRRVAVLLPLPLAGCYDYAVLEAMELRPGDFVEVPFGKRALVGVVWESDPRSEGSPPAARSRPVTLKPVTLKLPTPPMARALRCFIDWVARYTLSPPGAVLRMAMSVPSALYEPPAHHLLRRAEPLPALRITPARQRVLDLLANGQALTARRIAVEANASAAVLRAMLDAGALERLAITRNAALPPAPDLQAPPLGLDQQRAADALIAQIRDRAFSVSLLDGVTGSGKTEVYFAAIAESLRLGRQTLVLLPEIALTAQWLERFAHRFGIAPCLWHSQLTASGRRRRWRQIALGQEKVVIGARSALFLPLDRLGLIVVDEEHEASFKQEEGVLYHARDMAVVRGRLAGCPVALASATPSLESLANAQQGRYRHLHLPSRHGGAELPQVALIDLRRFPPPRGRWLAPPLVQAVSATLERQEQAMLFLNRRGYAPLTLCRACGYRLECPNCSAWLVEHRLAGKLVCHHCGHQDKTPAICPACGKQDAMIACGPGVERLAEETAMLWPSARIAIMTSDALSGPNAAAELVERMEKRSVDLLIGTQMMAKGHHFPHLTLVGVVDADLGLGGGDLRAGERTFQLLHQVAGRAGRAERKGRALLQTLCPEHPVLRALVAGDRDGFVASEMAERRRYDMPPFSRLAALIVSAQDRAAADAAARTIARAAPRWPDFQILGPAPAPLAVLRGRHRCRFLVKAKREASMQKFLSGWLDPLVLPTSVRLIVDIDPCSFL